MKNLKFSLLFFTFFICCIANATDYYISASGNNSNNGTSQTTPWQTLSKLETVCNNGTIKAGDNIFFKKGDNFTGTLLMTSLWGHHANSGTATQPITFSSYGSGAKPLFQYPQGSSTPVGDRIIMDFVGVNYVVVDGFNFTDLVNPTNDKFSAPTCGFAVYIGIQEEATSNHCTVKNIDVSLLGMGIAIVGDYNTVTNSTLTNFKDLINTNNGGSDDFGSNALTITGNYNQILYNYISGAWSYSSDYGWNGGACEMYNTCNGNKIMYNTIVDCEGISEYGGETGTTASDNMIAYNKVINCGQLSWANTTGSFAMQASNIQYFNNVIVENNLSRFSGPNTGAGNSHPLAQYPSQELFAYSGNPNATTVFNLKNNIFFLSTGIDVVRTSCAVKTNHQDNIYKLSGGGTANVTLGTSEMATTSNIFTNIAPSDPVSWDYSPLTGSPAIDFGQNVGITKDFAGNTVPSVPNAGILEGTSAPNTLSVTATPGTIACYGSTTTVTVTASGGTTPYTGTGSFTVGAGSYTYTVNDAAGNSKQASVTISQPTAIDASIAAPNVYNATSKTTATITATGGSPAYTYSLDAGTYQSGNTFSNVAVGTHSVKVKDTKGCILTKSFTVTVIPVTPLAISSVKGFILCSGGSTTVTISATGGISPYSGTGSFTVSAGTRTYTVTDASGATASTTVTVVQPKIITITATAGIIATYGAATTLAITASGGTGALSYKLNNGSFQSSNIFSNITAGTYTITVKDIRNCTGVTNTTITQPSQGVFKLNLVSKTNLSCHNKNDGTITVSGSAGTLPYTYKKSSGSYSSNNVFTNLAPGTYTITGKDATGATASVSVTISNSQTTCVAGKGADLFVSDGKDDQEKSIGGLEITAFPNPSSAQFTLSVNSASEEKVYITVMNLNGQKIFETNSAARKKTIFGDSFIAGIYFVKVAQGDNVEVIKLIKTK